MYLPYLRGKQFELLALRELLVSERISSKVVQPIFEPIKETSTFKNTLQLFDSEQYPLYTVINPAVGDFEKHEKNHPIRVVGGNQYDAILMSDKSFSDYSVLSESNGIIPVFFKADDLDSTGYLFQQGLQIKLNLIKDSSRLKRELKRMGQKAGLIRDAFEKKETLIILKFQMSSFQMIICTIKMRGMSPFQIFQLLVIHILNPVLLLSQ